MVESVLFSLPSPPQVAGFFLFLRNFINSVYNSDMYQVVLALVFSFSTVHAQETQVLVAALAKVGSEVLTSRDLQVNQFLNEQEHPFKNYNDKPEPLKELVWEQLVYLESKSVFAKPESTSAIQKFVKQFRKKADKDALWKTLEVTDKELMGAVTRKLNAKKLLNLKMPRKLIYVSPTHIASYYKRNKNQLGQKPLGEVRDRIREGLQILKARSRFYDWVSTMSRSHKVSYYSGFKIK